LNTNSNKRISKVWDRCEGCANTVRRGSTASMHLCFFLMKLEQDSWIRIRFIDSYGNKING
jgi:hypothetical protein